MTVCWQPGEFVRWLPPAATAAERVVDTDRATSHDNSDAGVSQVCCADLLATKDGILQRAVETNGVVNTEKMEDQYEDQRAYPSSADTERSPA